ncbi:sulfite reductase subunit alpha [Rubritalea spongiae]|uniref:Sulfite reductase subunit alpha n=1 Tax=Rubritalea spongiae TaxID=430797 RepID=A0ABW5E5D7_9BACT
MKNIILPEDAPFSPEQREWLNGYLSALLSPYAGEAPTNGLPISIAWGSQTGTSETLAKKFAKLAKKSGLTPSIINLADLDQSKLLELEHLIIITSTYGEGEPPDNAQQFYEFVHSDKAPKLENLKYSVLSLGDSSYPDFCKCGIDFDLRLSQLGAQPLIPRVDMDVDFDDDYAQWSNDLLAILGSASATSDDDEEETGYTKKNPFTANILKSYNLNGEDSQRETTHVEISLKDSDITYEAGDALGVYPINDSELVSDIIAALGFSPDTDISGKTLSQTLTEDYEIRNISPPLVKAWAESSASESLVALVSSDDRAPLNDYLWGREIIDLIKEHPIDFTNANDFLKMLKPLAARLYSIASSPKAHADEVHLTVGAVTYDSLGRKRKGVCSTYFSERYELAKPRVFVHANKAFRPPSDASAPMIMVGPGTGIAPFRAFLEEREATQADGKNWLFFGNPHASIDFLYQDQLSQLQKDGYLHQLCTAFSRDQETKVYVQDRMIEHGEELWKWINNNGHFYVCGDASRMAKDVDEALLHVIETHGEMTPEAAAEYVKQMKADKRYCRDVY